MSNVSGHDPGASSAIQFSQKGAFPSGVGSKAGSFAAQKPFHPSSWKNQKRMFEERKRMEEQAALQEERARQRGEERKVEQMQRHLGLRRQPGLGVRRDDKRGGASDSSAAGARKPDAMVRNAAAQTQARRNKAAADKKVLHARLAAQQQGAQASCSRSRSRSPRRVATPASNAGGAHELQEGRDSDRSERQDPNPNPRTMRGSRFREDVHHHGHTSVYGSHYDLQSGCWGHACCKKLAKDARCAS